MSKEEDHFIVVPLNPLRREADKKFIRDHIIGKSNEALVADKEAMKMLRDLGSDLNINVFACNFRLGGVANDDVEEANYLNNAVFKRLSITTPFIKSTEIPMFLSATTFKAAEYGVCLDDFKARLGLERTSGQDLFVLRNVVMSPFQTAGNFVEKIADIFRGVLVEELQVRRRPQFEWITAADRFFEACRQTKHDRAAPPYLRPPGIRPCVQTGVPGLSSVLPQRQRPLPGHLARDALGRGRRRP